MHTFILNVFLKTRPSLILLIQHPLAVGGQESSCSASASLVSERQKSSLHYPSVNSEVSKGIHILAPYPN